MTPTSSRERAEIAREHLRVADERLAACGEGPSREASVSASNSVSAAIAAADAICGSVLGHRSSSSDHREAAALLSQVVDGAPLARRLVEALPRYGVRPGSPPGVRASPAGSAARTAPSA